LPTPAATEYGSSQNGINGKGGPFERPSAGTPSLATMARRNSWPTPTARDHKDTGDLSRVPENSLLPRVVARIEREQWPTPKSSPSGPDYARANREDSGGDDLATAIARPTPGRLNPTWVEWLMGFPVGWTDLEPSGTRLSRKSPNGSDGGS
jgi:DNA (cytosine-5)-methyltransferase 1